MDKYGMMRACNLHNILSVILSVSEGSFPGMLNYSKILRFAQNDKFSVGCRPGIMLRYSAALGLHNIFLRENLKKR